jgi:N-acetylneuraminate lyase
VWTFFDRAMQLRYGIAIGPPKPPLLATTLPWSDEQILEMVEEIDRFANHPTR